MAHIEDKFAEKDRKYIERWGHEMQVPESVYGLLYSADPEFVRLRTIESARQKRDILVKSFPRMFGKGGKQDITGEINSSAQAVKICSRYESMVKSYRKEYPNIRTWKD